MRCLSVLWRKGRALTTVIAVLYSQILPAYAMQEGSSDEEQEPPARKRVRGSLPSDLKPDNIIDNYAEQLYNASLEEADAILENIPPHYKEEVLDRLVQKGSSTGSSSSLPFNVRAPGEGGIDYLWIEDNFKPAGEKRLVSMEEEGKQIESVKRKRVEDKEKLSGDDIKHKKVQTDEKKGNDSRYINRSESFENIYFNFDILPIEIQVKILGFVKGPRDIANSRLVSHQIKNVRDEHIPYPLSLQSLLAHAIHPVSFTGKKLLLSGWAPDLTRLHSLLFSEPYKLFGQIFVSNLKSDLSPTLNLKITLTVPTNEQAELKLGELENQGLNDAVHVRSRESLWNSFIKTDLVQNHPHSSYIIGSEKALSFLLDIDEDEKVLRSIISQCLLKSHVEKVLDAFANISTLEQRLHVASLLREEILAHCKDGYQIGVVLGALSKILAPEQRTHIASLLNEKILTRFKNKVDGAIYAFARVPTPEQRVHVALLLNERILARCQNEGGGAIIDALADISNPEERAYVASILSEKTLARCKDGNEVSVIINALARISHLNQLIYVASLLKEEIPSQCQNGYQIARQIKKRGSVHISKDLSKVYRN